MMTGESTSVVSEAVANLISFPLWLAMGSGVPNFHPAGSLRLARVIDVVRLTALGIEQNLVPADDGEFVGGGRSGGESAFEGCGRKKVEFGGDSVHARGDVDVEGESVQQIATPLESLARG